MTVASGEARGDSRDRDRFCVNFKRRISGSGFRAGPFRRLRRSLKRRMENGGTGCPYELLNPRARTAMARARARVIKLNGRLPSREAPFPPFALHAFAICVSAPFIAYALSRVERGLIASAYRSHHYALLRLSDLLHFRLEMRRLRTARHYYHCFFLSSFFRFARFLFLSGKPARTTKTSQSQS